MMKSLASLAALATMAMAGRRSKGPRLVVESDYSTMGETETNKIDFLGLKGGITSSIKFPKDRRARRGNCTGWTMVEKSYVSFDAEVVKPGKGCSTIEFTVKEDALE